MKCNFLVGDKVVCIAEIQPRDGENVPKLGGVYTISEILIHDFGPGKHDIGLRFVELKNTLREYANGPDICSFLHTCFKRVQPSRKSINELKKIMNNPPLDLIREIEQENTHIETDC